MTLFRKTFAVVVLAGAAAGAWTWLAAADRLRVQVLDVSGYTEDLKNWMSFRVTVGITNDGRDLVTVRRIHVEPDFADFNEAYSVGVFSQH